LYLAWFSFVHIGGLPRIRTASFESNRFKGFNKF
jgi:hypothetical protein